MDKTTSQSRYHLRSRDTIKPPDVSRFLNEYNFPHLSKDFSKPDIEEILAEDFEDSDFSPISSPIHYPSPASSAVSGPPSPASSLDLFGYEVDLPIAPLPPPVDPPFSIAPLSLPPATSQPPRAEPEPLRRHRAASNRPR